MSPVDVFPARSPKCWIHSELLGIYLGLASDQRAADSLNCHSPSLGQHDRTLPKGGSNSLFLDPYRADNLSELLHCITEWAITGVLHNADTFTLVHLNQLTPPPQPLSWSCPTRPWRICFPTLAFRNQFLTSNQRSRL